MFPAALPTIEQTGILPAFIGILVMVLLYYIIPIAAVVAAAVFLVRHLRNRTSEDAPTEVSRSLGEVLKSHRMRCGMTQELVAQRVGVSRQAVSKWETGLSEPSTSNLLALADLFGVSAEELLREIQK